MRFFRSLLIFGVFALSGCGGTGEADVPVTRSGHLRSTDAMDEIYPNSPFKSFKQKVKAGTAYKADLTSTDFDAFLRVHEPDGKVLLAEDDGAGGTNARAVFRAKQDGEYQFIVTTHDRLFGAFQLKILEATADDVLVANVRNLPELAAPERTETISQVQEKLKARGKDLAPSDMRVAVGLLNGLERLSDGQEAGREILAMKEILQVSMDPKIKKYANHLDGVARRVRLPGNPIEVRGVTLEGREFDWTRYQGKVVLVDFWATWCKPCIAEIPRMKKAYDEYHARGFEIVAINTDQGDKEKVLTFQEKRKLPWVCLFDEEMPADKGEKLSNYYAVDSIPLPILVDRDGKVVSMEARGPELDRLLEKLLGPAKK